MPKYITDNIEISFNEENSNKENYNEEPIFFLKEQFLECRFQGSNFGNVVFEGAISKMSFLRKQFILKRLDDSGEE